MFFRIVAILCLICLGAAGSYGQNGITSLKSYGAVGNGQASNATADTNAFLCAFGATLPPNSSACPLPPTDYLLVPQGSYVIISSLPIPSNTTVQFTGEAKLLAGSPNLTFFVAPSTVVSGSQIRDALLDGNGNSGVTGFSLSNFREKARIDNADMRNMEYGIVLQQLCWDLVIDNPHTDNVAYPLSIGQGSSAVDVRHPAFNNYTTGITVNSGTNFNTIGVSISDGYVQVGVDGIIDHGIGTRIQNIYFEANSDADIYLSSAINPEVRGTTHFGNGGTVAIRARQTSGALIFNPLMGSGNRSLGLYDFDASDSNAHEWHTSTSGFMNSPLGNVAGVSTFVTNP